MLSSLLATASICFCSDPANADPTDLVTISGNLDASSSLTVIPMSPPSFNALNSAASFQTFVDIFDSLNAQHTINIYFFHTANSIVGNTWHIQGYADGAEVQGGTPGVPSAVFATPFTTVFNPNGTRQTAVGTPDSSMNSIQWSNGATAATAGFTFNPFTQFASPSTIGSIRQECLDGCAPKGGLDFDGDDTDDFATYRPSNGYWTVLPSSGGFLPGNVILRQWGTRGDYPMPGDYDGDRKTDLVVWRPANGYWFICRSSTNYNCAQGTAEQWGARGDRPIKGDFDGDGKFDLTVWRPRVAAFFSKSSRDGSAIVRQVGLPKDIPLGDSPKR